jgi:hypothetical protein
MNRSGWQRLLLVLFLDAKTRHIEVISAPNITEKNKNPPVPNAP